MLQLSATVQVYLATGVTDMRKSINGLSMLVADQFELDPFSGQLFCFCNRRRDIVKLLYWNRNGFCLWHKRLEKDRFKWPEREEEVVSLGGRELAWLLDGLSVNQASAHRKLEYSIAG
ncbi:IS66 family insertion sequence element accessory protein TnpB [Desulfogranum mediterraneum]|uniref:IS66 family insertion sequence element accessory protein TnpB n=1 Tax=Desulfogranum mediterraneum TaxID=160661 RepID=UPI000417FD92|nr:IS66 family insertion sequence element accessory protein TnpB [Desulfogranum mediterraneum]